MTSSNHTPVKCSLEQRMQFRIQSLAKNKPIPCTVPPKKDVIHLRWRSSDTSQRVFFIAIYWSTRYIAGSHEGINQRVVWVVFSITKYMANLQTMPILSLQISKGKDEKAFFFFFFFDDDGFYICLSPVIRNLTWSPQPFNYTTEQSCEGTIQFFWHHQLQHVGSYSPWIKLILTTLCCFLLFCITPSLPPCCTRFCQLVQEALSVLLQHCNDFGRATVQYMVISSAEVG